MPQVRTPAGHPELCWCRLLMFITPTATPEGSGLIVYRPGWTGLGSKGFLSRHFEVSHTTIPYFQILMMNFALNLLWNLQASILHNITRFGFTSLNYFFLIWSSLEHKLQQRNHSLRSYSSWKNPPAFRGLVSKFNIKLMGIHSFALHSCLLLWAQVFHDHLIFLPSSHNISKLCSVNNKLLIISFQLCFLMISKI